MPKFTHLHTHSHYSILEAIGNISDLVQFTSKNNMSSIALTDNGNMFGAIDFYKTCEKNKIKPIFGLEILIDPKGIQDKSASPDKILYPLVLLAKDYQGYLNLIEIVTKARVEGYIPHPKIDKEILSKYSQGLICLTGDFNGELGQKILQKDKSGIDDLLKFYQDIFGDNLYLEIVPSKNTKDQITVNQELIKISEETKIELVLTGINYYIEKEKAQAHDIMLAIKNKTNLMNSERYTLINEDYSLKTPDEMWDLTQELNIPEQAFHNTNKIAELCKVKVPLYQIQLPHFDVPIKKDSGESLTDAEYLKVLCEEGTPKRYPDGNLPEGFQERLEYELKTINDSGYPSYFLIVSDFINWAKENGILVGPGRGSAAGSLVAYLVGITDLDPIQFELLFERFLNPARVSMPDIDIDFQDNKRDLVLEYVANKYGRDHVAQICTFGTMAAKNSIRDTGRALGYSYSLCDSIAKMIEKKTIQKSLDDSNELRNRYEQDDKVQVLIDTAQILEGSIRHTSTHACAVVISNKSLTHYTPLQISESGGKTGITTQFEMHAIEDLGLLKMDFLGLANLSIIESTLKLIKQNHKIEIYMTNLSLDDKNAYKLFQKGQTTGVFQFESAGMKKALIGLKPSEFNDLIAMVSLYRPGPMELIPTYIARKHREEEVKYLHPNLENILKPTYGIMIYQEQLMQASQAIAGFSLPEADILRKAVGKKIFELMEEQKVKIIEGTVKNGIEREIGEKLWELIEPFALYGFNKSHAACYALVAYQTAYLKSHYPLEFMVSLMNSDAKDLTRIAIEIEESKQIGLEIIPPSINTSYPDFVGKDKQIFYGLGTIRNMSYKLAEIIVNERNQNGLFKSFQDFLERIDGKELNKKNLEALIKSGCFDSLENRQKLIINLENILEYIKKLIHIKGQNSNQNSFLLSISPNELPKLELPPYIGDDRQDLIENLSLENTYLGCFVSGHPIDQFQAKINELCLPNIQDIKSSKRISNLNIVGVISSLKEITTKKGDKMAFIQVEDEKDNIEVILFPSIYDGIKNILNTDNCFIFRGKLDKENNQIKFIGQDVKNLSDENIIDWLGKKVSKVTKKPSTEDISNASEVDNEIKKYFNNDNEEVVGINIPIPKNLTKDKLENLKQFLKESPRGYCTVYFIINPNTYQAECLETKFKVEYSFKLIDDLKKIIS